ncbi:hypothetical protein [Gilliamella sp. Pas-s25]|uniref:hypothetical protein n=1 Tax=Gilliamella sp. Pas-s25 TaxID=2687310 RepID=UPI001365C86E|nr:hypothetical protein [Gilliamella sp. Pas-s25]
MVFSALFGNQITKAVILKVFVTKKGQAVAFGNIGVKRRGCQRLGFSAFIAGLASG